MPAPFSMATRWWQAQCTREWLHQRRLLLMSCCCGCYGCFSEQGPVWRVLGMCKLLGGAWCVMVRGTTTTRLFHTPCNWMLLPAPHRRSTNLALVMETAPNDGPGKLGCVSTQHPAPNMPSAQAAYGRSLRFGGAPGQDRTGQVRTGQDSVSIDLPWC